VVLARLSRWPRLLAERWPRKNWAPDESSRLQAALDAQGYSGGPVHISNDGFVVSRARCGDEKHYDFAFDGDFNLLSKNLRNWGPCTPNAGLSSANRRAA
jgi:hypothetical protein